MASLFTTGPAHLFVRVPPALNGGVAGGLGTPFSSAGTTVATILYVGTSEAPPKIQIRKANRPAFNDVAGQGVPFDKLYEGQEAYVFYDLSRFNSPVLELLTQTPAPTGRPGVDPSRATGTFWLTEGAAIEVFVQFPYATKPAYSVASTGGALRKGYHFPGGIWEGPEDIAIGTAVHKRMAVFHCLRVFDPKSQAFILYDENLNGLPAIN